jgi:RNA polymerase sigma-70 factor (ECF subfamily)
LATSAIAADAPASAEARLIEGVARRETVSLARFYETHVDGLYAFVFYRVGRDATLAEDAVQETFMAALARLDDYDPARGSIQAWLITLSRNVIRRLLRDHPRRRQLDVAERMFTATYYDWLAVLGGSEPSDELLARAETRSLVAYTIANLPERYRAVLEHKYVDGHSLAELGEALDLSEDAVKSLLARARRAFREMFTALPQLIMEGSHER